MRQGEGVLSHDRLEGGHCCEEETTCENTMIEKEHETIRKELSEKKRQQLF